MGRSKFPGKPSRSVIKDRIRVLNENESERKISSKRNRDNCNSCRNCSNCDTNIKKKKNVFQDVSWDAGNDEVQFHPGSNSTNSEQKTTSDSFDDKSEEKPDHIKNCSNGLEQKEEKTMCFTGNSHQSFANANENNVKKKTVTFKKILETSDDLLMPRNIHNPLNKGPLVSIMKKDCVRSQFYMPRRDRIVRPSRLTKILKNNANIDKTKFLSFRTVHSPISHESNNHFNEQDDKDSLACKIFQTGFEGQKNEFILKDQNETIGNCKMAINEKADNQSSERQNMQNLGPFRETFEAKDENTCKETDMPSSKRKDSPNEGQIVLRQPRLLLETEDSILGKSYQKLSNDSTESTFLGTKICNNSVCGVCGTIVNYKNNQQNRKYGITACEFCKTFISKIIKKTVAASPNSSKALKIQCVKKEGECLITSLPKNNFKSFKKIYDERCSACWLKKCIKSFHIPLGHKLRLSSLILESGNEESHSTDKSKEFESNNVSDDKFQTASPTSFSLKTKSQQEPAAQNNVFIESFGFVSTDLIRKATFGEGVHTRLNFLLNKNSLEMPNKSLEIQASSILTSDYHRRQKIAFKGPRVKHVCRSASIALGQQMATFANENEEALHVFESNSEMEKDLSENDYPQTTTEEIEMDVELDKEIQSVENNDKNVFNKLLETNIPELPNSLNAEKVTGYRKPSLSIIKYNHQNKENKCGNNTNGYKTPESKRNSVHLDVPKCENKSKMILIDFWDTYVSAEVNQTGFGVILTKPTTIVALCFLCGSMDLNDLLFCVCCCEPYHSYCIQEAYSDDTEFFDDKEALSKFSNQLNWMCPRCTVCDTCNMSSGAKIKCQKCKKNYHNTCMGISKRLLGADRPLICRSCLKCQFCSTSKVSRYVGNEPTCIQCFLQRRSVSTCSLCQKCIDSVVEVIILECGVCNNFIHAKCEDLTEEQTNLLSSIPGEIKFVCKKCSISNNKSKQLAKQWREALNKELQSRLLQVLRVFSKSRFAAILKKSTRSSCNCFNQTINKDQATIEESNGGLKYKLDNESSKCLCSKNFLSLLDIKKKILNGEYVSLFDFNADIYDVITPLKNDELILTYKEIISEKFSWFQNETKTCTDALEEDMFDSSNYSFQTENIIENENSLNKLSFPGLEKIIFTPLKQNADKRICIFCHKEGDGEMYKESRLIYYGFDSWVHVNCALWSMDVYEEFDGSLQNVHHAFMKRKSIKCIVCGSTGATIKCNIETCGNFYHFECAKRTECIFEYETKMFCTTHSTRYENNKNRNLNEILNVSRPLHIECNKSHKKYVEPLKVQFMLGSLSVIQLGTIYLPFSDTSEAIVPVNFVCTRLYWSSKEPWKVIKYRVRTSIQNSPIALNNVEERHFTVDHSKSKRLIERDMAQISYWHNTLSRGDNMDSSLKSEHGYLNNLRFSTKIDYRNETSLSSFTQEEPHNNSDLLLPEIEEAIFEDFPNDILDGISMLDIFPKLMIHESLDGIEGNTEKGTESTENNASESSISCVLSSLKNQDSKYNTQKREREIQPINEYKIQKKSPSVSLEVDSKRFAKDKLETRSFNLNSIKLEDCKLNLKQPVAQENKNIAQFMKHNIKLSQLDGADDDIVSCLNTQIQNSNSNIPVTCERCHCTYRTFDSFQRHIANCEQITASQSETDCSSLSPDSVSSIIITKDKLNKDNLQLYNQNQFASNQNILTNVKPVSNFNACLAETIMSQNLANNVGSYVQVDKADYETKSISGININALNKVDNVNIILNKAKSDQEEYFSKVKHEIITPIKTKKESDSNDKTSYLQIIDQNMVSGDHFSQKEQQPQQQPFLIIQQSAENNQPMYIHQPNTVQNLPQNMFPVVLSNNSMQYSSVPALTNSFLPSSFWQSDCNVLLSSGLQMMPVPSLQIAPPTPQLVGSFNLAQTLQLGSNQMLLGGTSPMNLMPNANQLLIAPQPMFYGLETIVQNTVMSSQQFVSTAIQGVLGQNASFSATTTQVFQSSKYQPASDASTSYVVLNNVDGTALVLPQTTNMLPGFLNTNNSSNFPNNYDTGLRSINAPCPQTIIQQTESNKVFPILQTLPETVYAAVKAPTNDLQDRIIKTNSSIVTPSNNIDQSIPLVENSVQIKSEKMVNQKWMATGTPIKKIEQFNKTSTSTQNNFLNDNNFPKENKGNVFEVRNTCPKIEDTKSTTNKVQITPKNIKKRNSSIAFSKTGLKVMYKNILQKELKSNQPQNVTLESPKCASDTFEILTEPTANDTPVTFSSNSWKSYDTSSKKIEFHNTRHSQEIPTELKILEPIESHSPSNITSIIENRKSLNLSSTKTPFASLSYGSSLQNVPTNVVAPILQPKQPKNPTSRPTNRVLPMQSIHKRTTASKPKESIVSNFENRCSENVESMPTLEVEVEKTIETLEKKFEFNKPIADISEIKKIDFSPEPSININIEPLIDTLSTKETEVKITTSLICDPDTNTNKEIKFLYDSDIVKNKNNISPNCIEKNMSEFQSTQEEKISSYDSEPEKAKSSSDIFMDNNFTNAMENYIKDLKLEKEKDEIELTSNDVSNAKESVEEIFQTDFVHLNKNIPGSVSPETKYHNEPETDQQTNANYASKKQFKVENKKSNEPYLFYEVQSEDGFCYKSHSISDVWEKIFEAVQSARRAYGLPSYPIESFADICGVQMLGLKSSALKYLIEQLPGTEKCQKYTPKYHASENTEFSNVYTSHDICSSSRSSTASRCEEFEKKTAFDIFSWLASKHRKQPKQIFVQPSDTELIARRCTPNLPMAMKYRTLKETCRLNVGVFRSLIHGRGLFCIKDMEAGEMVIEYAGELIRSTLADKRERYYDKKGIGCYMFKIDENFVVDATMKGNAARFINHSCEPNCYSKVVDILGHKHIIIFSLRRIVQGEELTYDYKFPFEDVKIHCYCGSKKCRKYLN